MAILGSEQAIRIDMSFAAHEPMRVVRYPLDVKFLIIFTGCEMQGSYCRS
jgi:hypothetical protein